MITSGNGLNRNNISLIDEGDLDFDDTPEQDLEKEFTDAFVKAKIPARSLKELIGRTVIVSIPEQLNIHQRLFATIITGVEIRNDLAYALSLSLQQTAKQEKIYELVIKEYPLAYLLLSEFNCDAKIQLL